MKPVLPCTVKGVERCFLPTLNTFSKVYLTLYEHPSMLRLVPGAISIIVWCVVCYAIASRVGLVSLVAGIEGESVTSAMGRTMVCLGRMGPSETLFATVTLERIEPLI